MKRILFNFWRILKTIDSNNLVVREVGVAAKRYIHAESGRKYSYNSEINLKELNKQKESYYYEVK